MKKPTLADLQAFMTVAERRSFRQAAEQLGVSRSALSHAMRGLESELGVRLLHRTTRSVSLTAAGERLLGRIDPLIGELNEVFADVFESRDQLTGTLRINGSEGAIRQLLQTVVPVFLERYPSIELDLVAQGRFVDIVGEGFDAGVRLGEALERDMVAVRIGGDVRFIPVASPGYIRKHGLPNAPRELLQHTCIRQRLPGGKRYRWEFARNGREITIDPPGALTLDSNTLMVEAAMAGLGIAYVPEAYARAAISRKRLVSLLDAWCPTIPGLYLYYPSQRHLAPGLRAFVDLVKAFRDDEPKR